ncbi:hypothetical protein ACFSUK_03935 [Sphingobium scionense]
MRSPTRSAIIYTTNAIEANSKPGGLSGQGTLPSDAATKLLYPILIGRRKSEDATT